MRLGLNHAHRAVRHHIDCWRNRSSLPPATTSTRAAVELGGLTFLIEHSNPTLGRLDGGHVDSAGAALIPRYVRKEALLSSQIEWTRSSLLDVLLFENDEISLVPLDDVQEVSNYVAAMNYDLKRSNERCQLAAAAVGSTRFCRWREQS